MAKTLKMVLVEWDDAHMEGWWITGSPEAPVPDLVRSVGFLAHKTSRHVVLVQTMTDGAHGNRLQIPRGMIKSLVELEPTPTHAAVVQPPK